jgi:hypothetical protein
LRKRATIFRTLAITPKCKLGQAFDPQHPQVAPSSTKLRLTMFTPTLGTALWGLPLLQVLPNCWLTNWLAALAVCQERPSVLRMLEKRQGLFT